MPSIFGDMGAAGNVLVSILMYAVLFGGAYLVLFRPQQKKRKQEEELRKNLQIGDEVTTIGGIVGRVISIKEDSDSIVIESGSDKIRIKKWAIASLDTAREVANK